MSQAFGIDMWVVGLVVALFIGLLIIGGVKRIAKVAEIVTPFMAIFYILLSLVVLAVHYQMIPHVFHEMLRGAVGAGPLGSAILGTTISWGVKRGLYSNEAGQGTGAIMAAPAKVDHPVKQGLVQAFSVYIDTLLVCTATAVMILACHTYNIIDNVQETGAGQTTVTYLQQNPNAPLGEPGVFYTIDAVATLVGQKAATALIAIMLLSSKALRALRDYEQARKKGEEPHFDPKKLDIKGAEFWETLNN